MSLLSTTLPFAATAVSLGASTGPALPAMHFDCAIATMGITEGEERPTPFTLELVPGKRPTLVKRSERPVSINMASLLLDQPWQVAGDAAHFSAAPVGGGAGIEFDQTAPDRYEVYWFRCEPSTRRSDGRHVWSHCGMYAGGTGTCTVIADGRPTERLQ